MFAVFHSRILECMDVSDAEALTKYINGLKQGTKDWVLIYNPSSLCKAAKWAELYNNTCYSYSRTNQALSSTTLTFERWP